MIKLGDYNELRVMRFTEHGAYLDGGDVGKILMPKAYVTRAMRPGQHVRVFVYLDQSERLVATTETPLAKVGDFAYLKCSWVNQYGAFLDWGLMKDLFVPFREQKVKMEVGKNYYVHVHIDPRTHRIVGSSKVERYLEGTADDRRMDFPVTLFDELKNAGGELPFSDNSTPEEILERFHVSKKIFKKAVGTLLKMGKVEMNDEKLKIKL